MVIFWGCFTVQRGHCHGLSIGLTWIHEAAEGKLCMVPYISKHHCNPNLLVAAAALATNSV